MTDAADEEWKEAYRRGSAAAKAGVRVDGAAEVDAALADARRDQPRLSNEELEQYWAPKEWGVLYDPPPPRVITPAVDLAARILRAKRRRK